MCKKTHKLNSKNWKMNIKKFYYRRAPKTENGVTFNPDGIRLWDFGP